MKIANMKLNSVLLAVIISTFFSVSINAQSEAEDIALIRAELVKLVPLAEDAEIIATEAEGVYRMLIQGNYVFAYVDGDFALIGDLLNTDSKENLGEVAANEKMADVIGQVDQAKMIVFGPDNPKRYITVFTDIDCGYCRQLHSEITQLNEAGIEVRYLAYPRAGVPSGSYDKYVSVWCSDDQKSSLTDAKAGNTPSSAVCDNPIAETFKLGQDVGVRGTPTMVFDDGQVVPGYVPYAELIQRLGLGEES